MNHSASHSLYFVAIVCPSPVSEKVLHFKQWMKDQFDCAVAMKSPAHITLIPPCWRDEIMETEMLQTLQSFSSDMGELEIQLEGFSHTNKKFLFIQVNTNPLLEELKKQTESHFIHLFFGHAIKKDNRNFHPHITIASRDMKPDDFEKAWQHFENKIFKTNFRSKTISLLKLTAGKWKVITEKRW